MNLVEEIPNGLFKNTHNFTFEEIFWDTKEQREGEEVGIFNKLRNVEPVRYSGGITVNHLREALNMIFETAGEAPVEVPGRGYVMGYDPVTITTESHNTTQEIQPIQSHHGNITMNNLTEEELINYFDRISQDEEQQTNTEH